MREMIGNSFAMYRLREQARQAARSDADILVEAESGTGKEVLARFIHAASIRSNSAFVAVNCAALPEALLESELFGHTRGAFTGAASDRRGKFVLADGGTLLLDEIGEMPLNLQPKLLRVLQEREVDPLGDSRTVPVDVRVIATTNRSLAALVEEGVFRADLYYRLNVIPLRIPPLRERREDIPALVEHFLRCYAKSDAVAIPPGFLTPLAHHAWPGNVRELENLVRRVLALGPEPMECAHHSTPATKQVFAPGSSMRDMEKQMLEVTLQATGGNRTHAAAMLGVSLRTVRNKIREFGLPARARGMA